MSSQKSPAASAQTPPNPRDTSFFGQPKMLLNLFSVELWERFSFYGMQGILAYYMYYSVTQGGLGIDEGTALGIVGAYGGGVYLSTILGAWVADRLMGSERVLFYSAILIMAGHLSLALIPGTAGLAAGLILIGIGSGGLKANATSLVGTLYAKDDERRDAGFSIFYMGINIGGLIGPLITGWLQVTWGFHVGFAAAAVGMALGLLQYGLTRKNLPETAHRVANPLPKTQYAKVGILAAAAVVVIVLAVAFKLITAENLKWIIVTFVILAAIAYFAVILSNKSVTGVDRSRVYSFIPLFLASAVFWSLFQQQFTVIALYADKRLDRSILGWEVPASWVTSINPVFIIVLAGVFAAIWTKWGARQPGTPVKFSVSLVVMGLAYLAFIPFSGMAAVPMMAIVGILLLFTVAELMLSPVGLSLATKLAPAAFQTQMVALFFLSVSLGTAMSGVLAQWYDPANETPYFLAIGLVSIGFGVALFLAKKPIKKLMAGIM
ncbi:proton-dependent oligopeptide transporter, POT family [Arthrobacter alpinus]|uniref:Proton-dependent oligopeptide transporter, POT family n=2 Tax=Arthrobacter alpinus TaxID=656366 RepID=A0A1H5N210_9MICC|nr:peptide MFS transporter [Arthrobacter alpinus]SEE95625.1 proton-dependent oligopeptide transporter, POT family [Arthrobacter alpinus]